ncbi:hypothetical protein LXA43DRAFT_1093056 [Ganoderma leucocontextum]|nr:hypothetical protein LXA43DRAFT_1093056 [Ganoderma leucocontextum]
MTQLAGVGKPLIVAQFDDGEVDASALRVNRALGRTHKWYTGTLVFDFGFGLHYMTSSTASGDRAVAFLDLAPLDTFPALVTNTGNVTSDYLALLFMNGTFVPAPHRTKQLFSYARVRVLTLNENAVAELNVTLGAIASVDGGGANGGGEHDP